MSPNGKGLRPGGPRLSRLEAPLAGSRPSATVPIPCMSCDLGLIPFTAKEGSHSIVCPRCRKATSVTVHFQGGRWLVHSALTKEAV